MVEVEEEDIEEEEESLSGAVATAKEAEAMIEAKANREVRTRANVSNLATTPTAVHMGAVVIMSTRVMMYQIDIALWKT